METSLYPHSQPPPAFGSYRTYEEWKHNVDDAIKYLNDTSSYRTYEEWKLISIMFPLTRTSVLTVPMRNGNLKAENEKLKAELEVLTVPMRNGNETKMSLGTAGQTVLTVPMRNGNM